MPAKASHQSDERILYSCYSDISREGEQFVPEHVFSYGLEGSNDLFINGKNYTFKAGDFRYIRRNQLAKFTKHPVPGGEYRAISIRMDQTTLRSLSEEFNLHPDKPYTGEAAIILEPKPQLKAFAESMKPYLEGTSEISKMITELKVKEIILLLLETSPELKDALFDFSEPGKIDLEAYMSEHYKFNVDISRFAYLTGRSLATFKRDFEKTFHTSPNRWLQQKRLDDAYYLLKEKGWKTSDVYMEVGFKDFSHFSFAFKKAYGVAPSRVA
ncbi:helix-turn-helix domain-containing protein [Mucilaginibacter agri]|uniref:Helix-turn-helix domain-containing protein n=1 Tax=Mucilaginibacter agri TaxID=2695265 RepID=A0A965ZF80_9SPHI|nr:AraC family transcriptional regulator [Mucilaginibacter agri]NCD68672.1 helix-turn-helix domain-containing protein [Mucilaginibacter agri]